MRQYLDAVKQILETGTRKANRTGVDTLSTFGVHYNIDLQRGFPLLTTKSISWKNIVVEMLWFLSGSTDISILKKHGCKFWDAWADENGKVPSAYGHFWRQFPVHFADATNQDSTMRSFIESHERSDLFNDQIKFIVDTLKRDPSSRRMVVSAWAPANAQTSKLPPCHCLFVVNVQNVGCVCPDDRFAGGKNRVAIDAAMAVPSGNGIVHEEACGQQRLCLHLTQRSCDIALGVPYNIASYALLMHLLSRFSGIPVGTFSHLLVDAHAYTSKTDGSKAEFDHVPGLREQLTRQIRLPPTLRISDEIKSLEDVERLMGDDISTEEVMKHFILDGYEPWPAIPFKVAV